MVKFSLKKTDIECDSAKDGVDGLNRIKHTTPPYQFVLVDVNMPSMDGMEMLRQVRKECPAYNNVPFVFLTTSSDKQMKEEARTLGVKAWMIKPFSPEKLIEIINRFSVSSSN